MPGRRWLSDSEFEDEKWRRRAERLNAPRRGYVCEKCGAVGVPRAHRGYELDLYTPIHVNGPWHLPSGKVNPEVCRGRLVLKELPNGE